MARDFAFCSRSATDPAGAAAPAAPAAASVQDIYVPDIGSSGKAKIIELLVKVGDTVEADQSLITLESDKASMEIPSPAAGVVEAGGHQAASGHGVDASGSGTCPKQTLQRGHFMAIRAGREQIQALEDAQKAAKEICKLRYEAFGCAGQASKIKPLSLDKMAERYAKGELNQIVR